MVLYVETCVQVRNKRVLAKGWGRGQPMLRAKPVQRGMMFREGFSDMYG